MKVAHWGVLRNDGHLESLTREGQIGFDKATRNYIGSGERHKEQGRTYVEILIRKYLSESQELKDYKFGWIKKTKGERNGVSWCELR